MPEIKCARHPQPKWKYTRKSYPKGKAQCWQYSYTIHPRTREELQEDLWLVWFPNHLKKNSTLRQLLVRPKDNEPKEKESSVIYSYQCGETAYNEEYIGETSRTPGEIQGVPEATLSHPCTHSTIWSQFHTRQLKHPQEGEPGPSQDHKGGSLHQGKQSHS